MSGRVVLVTGIANERSLAAAVARAVVAGGDRVVVTWQDERLRPRLERVCAELGEVLISCQLDVSDEQTIAACMDQIGEQVGRIDGLLHAIAFGRLSGPDGEPMPVLEVDEDRFCEALRISAHSLALLCRHAVPLFQPGSAVVALSYLGAQRALSGYNLMGVAKAALEAEVRYLANELGPRDVRVNAVSAGPVRTLAASGVPRFSERLAEHAERAPLRRNIKASEVGEACAWLLSPAASGITGQTVFVDAGFSIT